MLTSNAFKILVGVLVLLGVVFIGRQLYIAFFAWSFSSRGFEYRESITEILPYLGNGEDSLPQWTPDGAHIVFTHGPYIQVVDSAGSRLWSVDSNDAVSPNVSPDGSRVAYTTYKHSTWFPWNKDHDWEIVTTNLNGSDRHRLTKNEGYDVGPVWSPDGSRIAFISGDTYDLKGIYVMATDGSDVRPVVKFADLEPSRHIRALPPVWSPDGNHIAFVAGVGEKTRMYVVRPDGTGLMRLEDTMSQLAWSPDGHRIAFAKRDYDSSSPSGVTTGIYTIGLNGSDSRKTGEFPSERFARTDNMSWSPDGSRILFQSYIIEADGSAVRRLPNLGHRASWSPDGSRIAVYTSRRPVILHTMAPDGSDIRVLVKRDEDGNPIAAKGRPLR